MLYKFKSRASADLILLEPQGRQILEIVGKDPDATQGIITVAQIPAAIAALKSAIAAQQAEPAPPPEASADADAQGDEAAPAVDPVRLYQRAAPFIDMLQRSAAEGKDVVWGV
jgi:hypothetical protein